MGTKLPAGENKRDCSVGWGTSSYLATIKAKRTTTIGTEASAIDPKGDGGEVLPTAKTTGITCEEISEHESRKSDGN